MHPTGNDTVTLGWHPREADYRQAFWALNLARGLRRKLIIIGGIGALVAVLGWALQDPGLLVIGLAVPVAVPLIVPVLQRLSVRSIWRRNPAIHAAMSARVEPVAGIYLAGETTGCFPWSATFGLLETEHLFVLQLAGYRLGLLLLAKRGLADPSELGNLRELLVRSVPTAPRQRDSVHTG